MNDYNLKRYFGTKQAKKSHVIRGQLREKNFKFPVEK